MNPFGRAAFMAAALALASAVPALAQTYVPIGGEIVGTDGSRLKFGTAGLWAGIDGGKIWLGSAKLGKSLPRTKARFVCPRQCPKELPAAAAGQDTVLWQDGSRSVGQVEIRCERNSNSECNVYQDGKRTRPAGLRGEWHEIVYVQFAG